MASDTISHDDDSLNSFLEQLGHIDLESSCYLVVLAGPNKSAKEAFLKKLSATAGELNAVDMRDLVSSDEQGSYKKIDALFQSLRSNHKNLYLAHADALSGEYTGFTLSSTRYATPQEKYLLKKIKVSEKIVIMDLHDFENVTSTLARNAQKIIRFDKPSSFPSNLFWKLKQIHVHGSHFTNKRESLKAT